MSLVYILIVIKYIFERMKKMDLITYIFRGLAIIGFLGFAIKGVFHLINGRVVKDERWLQMYKSVNSFIFGIIFWVINLFVYDFQNEIRIIALVLWAFIMTTVLLFRYFGIPFIEKYFNKDRSI
jgi:hypothetical protein